MNAVHANGFLAGPGEVAALLRSHAASPHFAGRIDRWPSALRTLVGVMLGAKQPMFLAWGAERLMFYNDGYAGIMGERHPAALGQPFATVWADILAEVEPIMDRAFGGEPTHMDDIELLMTRHGERQRTHFSFSYTPVRDDDDVVTGVFCVCTETTRTVLAEQTRAAEEQRRLRLFERAPGFIAILRGPGHVYEFVNESYARLFPGRDFIGRSVREAFPDIEDQGIYDLLDRVFAAGERFVAHHLPIRLQPTPDVPATEVFLDFIFEPIVDAGGEVTGIFIEGSDVTAAHRAQAALRQSDQRFRAAMNAIGVLWTNDAQGRMVGEQPGWTQLTGQTEEQYTGYGWSAAVHPDDARPTVEAWNQAVAQRRTFVFEHRVRRCDGQWRRFAIRAVPVLDADGVAQEWVGVHIDITEAAAATEALRMADRRKDEFLATLAHELRNPLAPIRNAAHLLAKASLTPEELRWSGEVINRQSANMALLLDDLLDVSRITSGRLDLRRDHVSLQSVVEAAVETARPAINAKRHALEVRLPAHAVQLEVDRLRMAQVLTNLLTNAAKYTDPGGRISLRAVDAGDHVEVSLSDTGIGVAPDAIESLFTMFGQVRAAVDRAEGGLGIGLALAKGLVELHGGRIEAMSAGLGRGTTFTLRLPLGRVGERPLPFRAVATEATGAGRVRHTVLVADDNVDGAQSLAMVLSLEGHEVFVTHDGHEALEVGSRVRPQVVILDIGMPGLDGYEVARRIRLEAWGGTARLIALTGWGQEDDKRRASAAGFDDHLTKPVDPLQVTGLLAGPGP